MSTQKITQAVEPEPDASAEDLTGRYQVRRLTAGGERPHVIVDTLDSDHIVPRSAEPGPGYRSRVAAQTAADRLNQATAEARTCWACGGGGVQEIPDGEYVNTVTCTACEGSGLISEGADS